MPLPFPHEYSVELVNVDGSIATLKGEGEPELRAGPPAQFDGPGGLWSPETLFLAAIELCYLTTLAALARRRDVKYRDYSSRIRGYLEKGPQGILFTRIELDVKLVAADLEAMGTLLQAAKKHCIISNAIRTEVKLNVDLSAERVAG
jgi:organic hydroperoxide reductase OsmC/OhrA